MQIVNFNITSSVIEHGLDSRAIRIAYLLGKQVIMAGNIVYDFSFRKNYGRLSFTEKVQFIAEYWGKYYTDYDSNFSEILKQLKDLATEKKKMGAKVKINNRNKYNLLQLMHDVPHSYGELMTANGFLQLKDLIDHENVVVVSTDNIDQEKAFDGKIKASSILKLDFEQKENAKIFILNDLFFEHPFADKYKCVGDYANASEVGNVYMWTKFLFHLY